MFLSSNSGNDSMSLNWLSCDMSNARLQEPLHPLHVSWSVSKKITQVISSSLSQKTSSVILSDPCRWVLLVVQQIQEELASFGTSLIGCRPLRGSTRPCRLAKKANFRYLVILYGIHWTILEAYTVNIAACTIIHHPQHATMPWVLLSHLRYASWCDKRNGAVWREENLQRSPSPKKVRDSCDIAILPIYVFSGFISMSNHIVSENVVNPCLFTTIWGLVHTTH